MNNGLPAIYWYVFWLVIFFSMLALGFFLATIEHRRNLKALEILKSYAEKGAEPPAQIADLLTKKNLDRDSAMQAATKKSGDEDRRSSMLGSFIGFLFAACIAYGLNAWLVDTEGAKWAIHSSQAAFGFFSFGAFGFFVASIITRNK